MIEVVELAPQDLSLDGDLADVVAVRNAVVAHALGSAVLDLRPTEMLPAFTNPWRPRRLWLAREDGRAVGRASMSEPPSDAGTSSVVVEVLAERRGRGIGSQLADAVEHRLAETGRTAVEVTVEHAGAIGGPAVDDPGARFLRARGFDLVQVGRISALEVPAVDVEALERGVADHAADYDVETWTTITPTNRLDDLARLREAMSTDEPLLGRRTVEAWDAGRVRRHDADALEAGRPVLVAAAVHRASGRVVGFTELSVPADGAGPVFQEDTIVLGEHRGHRLGTALKTANLRRLRTEAPDVRGVVTVNKEDNVPMLAVNDTLGFRTIGHEGVWQR